MMKAHRESADRRHTFTLLELLVVLAIVCGVAGTAPAGGAAQHDDAAARISVRQQSASNRPRRAPVSRYDGQFPARHALAASQGLPYPSASWLTMLLPYIEQGTLWNATVAAYQQSPSPYKNPPHVGLSTVMPIFACPADPRAEQVQFAPRDQILRGPDLLPRRRGAGFVQPRWRFLPQLDDPFRRHYGWYKQHAIGGRASGQRRFAVRLVVCRSGAALHRLGGDGAGRARAKLACPSPKARVAPGTYSYAPGSLTNQCDMFHFWSPHIGGAFFLFADGSAHFLPYAAVAVLPALASRAGGEVAAFPD